MMPYPHKYLIDAYADEKGEVVLKGKNLPKLSSAPPLEFGGPGDLWSPETLLVAAVADCFILSFKAIARASKLPWQAIRCDAEGVLNIVDGSAQFTHFFLHVSLSLKGGDEDRATRLLLKAKKSCLITNSLTATVELDIDITNSN